MKRVGLIINPWAGMGGRVGLKGTDGAIEEAISRGAQPTAEKRTSQALEALLPIKEEMVLVTCAGRMGGDLAEDMGFKNTIIWHQAVDMSRAEDTIAAAKAMIDTGVDLILFAGGDGTARDMYTAIGEELTCVGIPAGVKIHSPVYAQSPVKAGELVKAYLSGTIRQVGVEEVVDLDEEAYRIGQVRTRLFGYLKVPSDKRYTQCRKAPTPQSDAAAQDATASFVASMMVPGMTYILGPGTTTRRVAEKMGLEGTLLGIDVIRDGKVIAKDADESTLLRVAADGPIKLILAPTGGQGYVLGRGNQQISPALLSHVCNKDMIVLCTKEKIAELKGRPLLLDTGDTDIDKKLAGYLKLVVGYGEYLMYKLEC